MPLTPAEKQRRYREKRDKDPERRAEYLRKEQERWKRYREDGIIKYAKDMTNRESRYNRLKWKKAKRKSRERAKTFEDLETPPASPPHAQPGPSTKKKTGRKQVKKSRAKCYREIEKLRKKLKIEKKRVRKYKKRAERAEKTRTQNGDKSEPVLRDTPRSQTRRLLRHFRVDSKVKKRLHYHYHLIKNLKTWYRGAKGHHRKRALFVACTGLKKKYMHFTREIGFPSNMWYKYPKNKTTKKPVAAAERLKNMVHEFFVRDDVSRMTTGKKETKSAAGEKRQKRFLTDNMTNLHLKFLAESHVKISYSLFCGLRPFWVVIPTVADRDTCLCKTNDNLELQVKRLKQLKILSDTNIEQLIKTISCSLDERKCMYGECQTCSSLMVPVNPYNGDEQISWLRWENKTESKLKNGKEVSYSRVAKVMAEGTVDHLVQQFQKNMSNLKRHTYNIRRQYQMYRKLRENLCPDEILIHIDFAENYSCKYGQEIQSVHFGGGHQQVTLHTGVIYIGNKPATSFCTISPCLDHGPQAIWSYFDPVLKYMKEENPQLSVLHFYSDGPVTQYRQKLNFYLFSENLFHAGFTHGTWNYFEVSHGKGAPDGIGGALKRAADKLVANGEDIPDAKTMFEGQIIYQALLCRRSSSSI